MILIFSGLQRENEYLKAYLIIVRLSPNNDRTIMDVIALRDKKIQHLTLELKNRQQLLCKNRARLEESAAENEFMKEVAEDYMGYLDRIRQTKEEQIRMLKQLHRHIDSVTKDLGSTYEQLQSTKFEQNSIRQEIRKIKGELNDMLGDGA